MTLGPCACLTLTAHAPKNPKKLGVSLSRPGMPAHSRRLGVCFRSKKIIRDHIVHAIFIIVLIWMTFIMCARLDDLFPVLSRLKPLGNTPQIFCNTLQIFCNTCRFLQYLQIFCNTKFFLQNLQIFCKTLQIFCNTCRFSATLYTFSAIPADFLQYSADFLQNSPDFLQDSVDFLRSQFGRY